MKALLQTFGQLLQLKEGPQALPYVPPVTIAAMILLTLLPVGLTLGTGAFASTFIFSLVTHGFTFLATYWVLAFYKKSQRFMQTAFALAGCLIILNIMMYVVSSLLLMLATSMGFPAKSVAMFVLLLGSCWALLIQGNIYRHALEVRLGLGLLVTLAIAFTLAAMLTLLKVVIKGV